MQRFLAEYLDPLVPFFDHFLRQKGDYNQAPVRWRLDGGAWRNEETWPPANSHIVRYALTHNAELIEQSLDRSLEEQLSWQHDPANPVPSLIHPYFPNIAQVDEQSLMDRADVLCFTGPENLNAVELAGDATLHVWMRSSAPSAHLMATLYDLAPDGAARRIVDGASYVRSPWPTCVTVDLGSIGYRVEPGHRLRLILSGSSFPRYMLHPGNASDSWTTETFNIADQTIIVGGARGAILSYHVIQKKD